MNWEIVPSTPAVNTNLPDESTPPPECAIGDDYRAVAGEGAGGSIHRKLCYFGEVAHVSVGSRGIEANPQRARLWLYPYRIVVNSSECSGRGINRKLRDRARANVRTVEKPFRRNCEGPRIVSAGENGTVGRKYAALGNRVLRHCVVVPTGDISELSPSINNRVLGKAAGRHAVDRSQRSGGTQSV